MVTLLEIDGLYFNSPYDEAMKYKIAEKQKAIIDVCINTADGMAKWPIVAPALFEIGRIQALCIAQQPIMPSKFTTGEIIEVNNKPTEIIPIKEIQP